MADNQAKLTTQEVKQFNAYVRLVGTAKDKKLLQQGVKKMVFSPEGLQIVRSLINRQELVRIGLMPQDEAQRHNAASSTNKKTGLIRIREDLSVEGLALTLRRKLEALIN